MKRNTGRTGHRKIIAESPAAENHLFARALVVSHVRTGVDLRRSDSGNKGARRRERGIEDFSAGGLGTVSVEAEAAVA